MAAAIDGQGRVTLEPAKVAQVFRDTWSELWKPAQGEASGRQRGPNQARFDKFGPAGATGAGWSSRPQTRSGTQFAHAEDEEVPGAREEDGAGEEVGDEDGLPRASFSQALTAALER